jgi:small redox-active disulfide protein 2
MEDPARASLIEILGPGCARCQETYKVVREVVEAGGLDCQVDKNQAVERLVELGVLRTPAVVIDGKVVFSGRIPTPDDVKKLLGLA